MSVRASRDLSAVRPCQVDWWVYLSVPFAGQARPACTARGRAATGCRPQSRRCTQVVGSRASTTEEGGSERRDSVSRSVPWTRPPVVLRVCVCTYL